MNATEAGKLCNAVRSLAPSQKFELDTDLVWAAVMSDVAYADAVQAVGRLGRRQTYIAPADIIAEVRTIRCERLDGVDAITPEADPDDVRAYIAELRRIRADVANGRREVPKSAGALEAGIPDVVREAIEAAMPRPEQAARARNEAARQAEEAERARQMAALVELPDDDEASDA